MSTEPLGGVVETTNLSTEDLGGITEVTGVSPSVLAAIAARSAAGVRASGPRVVRGSAAALAIAPGFTSVDDLDEPLTDVELTARLSPAERARRHDFTERGYREGFDQGHRDGYLEGRAEALRELAAHAASAIGALHEGAEALARRDAVTVAELDPQVADFAIEVAAAILEREVAATSDPGRDAIARALRFAPDRGTLVARLHPDDLAILDSVADLAPGRDVTLVADAGIERGGCILDIGACRIDSQISTALGRVADALDGTGAR